MESSLILTHGQELGKLDIGKAEKGERNCWAGAPHRRLTHEMIPLAEHWHAQEVEGVVQGAGTMC